MLLATAAIVAVVQTKPASDPRLRETSAAAGYANTRGSAPAHAAVYHTDEFLQ
jgi:hypothetical protein